MHLGNLSQTDRLTDRRKLTTQPHYTHVHTTTKVCHQQLLLMIALMLKLIPNCNPNTYKIHTNVNCSYKGCDISLCLGMGQSWWQRQSVSAGLSFTALPHRFSHNCVNRWNLINTSGPSPPPSLLFESCWHLTDAVTFFGGVTVPVESPVGFVTMIPHDCITISALMCRDEAILLKNSLFMLC